jgi:hypothetical protein
MESWDRDQKERPPEHDTRLFAGTYLTRRDGGGGLFEVIAVWWFRNFGLLGRYIGVALLEDAKTGEVMEHPPERLLTDYALVRPAAASEA